MCIEDRLGILQDLVNNAITPKDINYIDNRRRTTEKTIALSRALKATWILFNGVGN